MIKIILISKINVHHHHHTWLFTNVANQDFVLLIISDMYHNYISYSFQPKRRFDIPLLLLLLILCLETMYNLKNSLISCESFQVIKWPFLVPINACVNCHSFSIIEISCINFFKYSSFNNSYCFLIFLRLLLRRRRRRVTRLVCLVLH